MTAPWSRHRTLWDGHQRRDARGAGDAPAAHRSVPSTLRALHRRTTLGRSPTDAVLRGSGRLRTTTGAPYIRRVAGSGLAALDVALLDAVDLVGSGGEPVRCDRALDVCASRDGADRGAAWARMLALGSPVLRHLPLLELMLPRDRRAPEAPGSAEVRLSPYGVLALRAERGELGPVPLDLVDGTWWCGGDAPPFDPLRVVGALLAGATEAGGPSLPSGGVVVGDVDRLLAGEPTTLTMSSTVRAEGGHLVATALPYGVEPADAVAAVRAAAASAARRRSGVVAVADESNAVDGVRVRVELADGTDLRRARDWLVGVVPLSLERTAVLPAAMPHLLDAWDRGDGTGLRALADLLAPPVPPQNPEVSLG